MTPFLRKNRITKRKSQSKILRYNRFPGICFAHPITFKK
ncbi:hypothetical protein LBBP_02213 [Leptospira borgpetersenii serovar Ballum]|uniref:Uncharacterized protein n=1 Tax=Leptospira borgpetersenii serovar Ballum TaxID=280505 RepID=A0A0S2ISI4_LEPBO|nr:hypothetical protein LBBP_02213 [Leptospira borgpetersenii serovar Ballum]